MAANQTPTETKGQPADDIPLASLEESLLSLEKMDRASPELWPEQMPGISQFAQIYNSEEDKETPAWEKKFNTVDWNYFNMLGNLPPTSLIMEVKKLHDTAYTLGMEEAKEMTRGKYLNIFKKPKQYSNNSHNNNS